ncbi:MAG: Fur family transcriptional regulator [bacterium]|nr:Fur family transcriptional regulator [bacterium]
MKRENLVYSEEIKEILLKKGIAPSFQRIKIYEYLISHRVHPSAERVYIDLVGFIPTLSRTTVHSTLNLFADKGMARRLFIDGNLVRFDIDSSDHMHFKCTKCGEVYDILKSSPKVTSPEHKVLSGEMYLYGICKKCKEE